MSSHAAAAISAMITSQVYPQPTRAAKHTRRRSRSQELRPAASLPKGKVIGTVQVTIGIVLIGMFFVSVLNYVGLYTEAQVASVVGCVVYTLSGLVSAFAKGQSGIKAAIFINSLGSLTAFVSIIIYCLCVRRCWDGKLSGARFYKDCNAMTILGTFLSLSILDLFVAVLTVVLGYRAIWRKEASGLAASRLEGHAEWEHRRQNAEAPATQQP